MTSAISLGPPHPFRNSCNYNMRIITNTNILTTKIVPSLTTKTVIPVGVIRRHVVTRLRHVTHE